MRVNISAIGSVIMVVRTLSMYRIEIAALDGGEPAAFTSSPFVLRVSNLDRPFCGSKCGTSRTCDKPLEVARNSGSAD
jgi:hypothetical protein